MSNRIGQGKSEREAGKRHRRGSSWTNYGPAAGRTLKLGRKKSRSYAAGLTTFSRTGKHPTVIEAESQEPARPRAVSVGPERVQFPPASEPFDVVIARIRLAQALRTIEGMYEEGRVSVFEAIEMTRLMQTDACLTPTRTQAITVAPN
jgi:hypothetical protein